MLQILLEPTERYSIPEQAQMALEGGATWLICSLENTPEEEVRETATELTSLCRENSAILTFVGSVDLAREMGVHGVFVKTSVAECIKIRELLGPEAIIGAEISSAEGAEMLSKADIDYVALPVDIRYSDAEKIITQIRERGCDIPVVAQGAYISDNVPELLNVGFSGVCTGRRFYEAPDPVVAIEHFISALTN